MINFAADAAIVVHSEYEMHALHWTAVHQCDRCPLKCSQLLSMCIHQTALTVDTPLSLIRQHRFDRQFAGVVQSTKLYCAATVNPSNAQTRLWPLALFAYSRNFY
jgi:hypothetical protein